MAEPKRITVTQIGGVKPTEKQEKRKLCHRFTLSLVRSTEKTCPEFSYNDLLKNALGGDEEPSGDEQDPFAGQDKAEQEKLEALARSFEEKYAPVKQKKKHKYNRIQEFVDLGDGYDDADPFIDNTEAYDELVPSCLTTQHGGFYINSGKLDFRAVSDSEDEFQSMTKKKHKKKKFKDEDDMRKKKRKKLSSDGSEKSVLKRKFERDGFRGLKLKRKKLNNVSELLNLPTSTPNSTAADAINGSQSEGITEKAEARTISAATLLNMESAIDSVISQSRNMSMSSSDEDSHSVYPRSQPSQEQNEDDKTKLPEHLPSHVHELVSKLKQAACESEMGKKKFFTPKVNQMLLQVENGIRQLPAGIRTTIYSHLASYLPCSKETLIKRAKKLRLDQNDDKLREPIAKLKEVINKSMPALIDKHQAELQAVQQMKRERKLEMRENGNTESDEESEKPDGDKQKRIMAPRRKFEWTPDVRNLLNQIVQIKLNHYELSKIRSQTPEDYLKAFFEQELKPLWPQGWMQSRMLFKESRAIHQRWTNPSYKPRRPLAMITGMRMTSPVTTNSKQSMSVSSGNAMLPSVTADASTPSGENTTLVPSIQKKWVLVSSSCGSSDTSSTSSGSPVSTAKSTLDVSTLTTSVVTGQPSSKGDSVMQDMVLPNRSASESHAQDLAASGAKSRHTPVTHKSTEDGATSHTVTSTSRLLFSDMTLYNQPQSSTQNQSSGSQSAVVASSAGGQKNDNSIGSFSAVVVDVGSGHAHESSSHSIAATSKPHLAAAFQGMYFPADSAGQKSSQPASHSYVNKSQVTHVTLKDASQGGHKTTAGQGQRHSPSSSYNNTSTSTVSRITSNKCQVKLSDVLLSNQKSQSKQQVASHQGSNPSVTASQHRMVSSNQAKVTSNGSRSQKQQASSPTGHPSMTKAGAASAGKKFQISPSEMSMIRAGLAQAATQMVLKAQEKQVSSAGPKQTGASQAAGPMATKSHSSTTHQVNPTALTRVSPTVSEGSLLQKPVTTQAKRSSPLTQSGERSQVAAPKCLTQPSSSVSRGHSIQEKLPSATEQNLFAIPGMPAATLMRTVAVNQVSSTSGTGNSAHSPQQSLINKAGVDVQVTIPTQSVHGATAKRQTSSTPVLQSSSTASPHTISRSATPQSNSSHHPVSTATVRQTLVHSSSSHVTSSSSSSASSLSSSSSGHGTGSQTSMSSSVTGHSSLSSQAAHGKMPSANPHMSHTLSNSHLSQPATSSHASISSHHPTISSHAQQSHATYSSCIPQTVASSRGQPSGSSSTQLSPAGPSVRVELSQPLTSSAGLGSNHPMSYSQTIHSRPDSTSSASKSSEPKFGGLTLSQIQAQTLKASQKAHIQSAQQYSPQVASTSPIYRSPEGNPVYGIAQLPNCGYGSSGRSSQSVPGYSNISPSSLNHNQTNDPNHSANSPYGMLRTPPNLSHHNSTSPARKPSQNRY